MKIRVFPLLILYLLLLPQPARADAGLTQRDWMIQLVETLGWSFGLPDEPTTDDYRQILEGRRTFRIEAEKHHHPDDQISVQRFQSFGPFSGEGWLSGTSSPTVAHLNFNLPLGGDFTVSVVLRLPGHRLQIGGQMLTIDGNQRFARHPLGTCSLPAGNQEVELFLPPNSAVDYLEFTAADLPPVQPVAGWQPEEPLTVAVMAETAAQVFALNALFPPAAEPVVLEAEASPAIPPGVSIVQAHHLGEPNGGAWVRAGAIPATFRLSFQRPQAGIYALQVRAAAEAPLTVTINEGLAQQVAPLPYLHNTSVGTFILPAGENVVDFHLPPRGGLDAFFLFPAATDNLFRLTGLTGNTDPPPPALVESYLALLASIGGSR